MTTVFISGSMGIKHLDQKVKERIDNITNSGFSIVLGDADGVDAATQSYLLLINASDVTVYCSGSKARNNTGDWLTKTIETKHADGTRLFYTAKDIAMADIADYGLMIWDARSTGTLSNVIELLTRKKKSVIYINKSKSFITVSSIPQLETLISMMSEFSQKKADQKIGLHKRIASLKNQDNQAKMFA
jgi:hypothetical protein